MPNDDTTKILAEADRLIRRRVFVATPPVPSRAAEAAAEPDVSTAIGDGKDDNLPVLTEVVTHPMPGSAIPEQFPLDAVHKELTRWLEEELPAAVLKVTDGVADQLMREITHQAEKQLLPRLIAHLGRSEP